MRDVFIANVTMQVIERHFMRDLAKVISSQHILADKTVESWNSNNMETSLKTIKELVAAPPDIEHARERLDNEIQFLQNTLAVLQRRTSIVNGM